MSVVRRQQGSVGAARDGPTYVGAEFDEITVTAARHDNFVAASHIVQSMFKHGDRQHVRQTFLGQMAGDEPQMLVFGVRSSSSCG